MTPSSTPPNEPEGVDPCPSSDLHTMDRSREEEASRAEQTTGKDGTTTDILNAVHDKIYET